jgi:hypothetical protein
LLKGTQVADGETKVENFWVLGFKLNLTQQNGFIPSANLNRLMIASCFEKPKVCVG